jgi:hypothetical protein
VGEELLARAAFESDRNREGCRAGCEVSGVGEPQTRAELNSCDKTCVAGKQGNMAPDSEQRVNIAHRP